MHNWTWTVVYDDGSCLSEDSAGGFGAVNIPRVTTLLVYDRNDPTRQHVVHLRDGMRPIFFRRKRKLIELERETPSQEAWVYAIGFGWQKTVNGRNVKSLIWLMHDGDVVMTDRDLDDL